MKELENLKVHWVDSKYCNKTEKRFAVLEVDLPMRIDLTFGQIKAALQDGSVRSAIKNSLTTALCDSPHSLDGETKEVEKVKSRVDEWGRSEGAHL